MPRDAAGKQQEPRLRPTARRHDEEGAEPQGQPEQREREELRPQGNGAVFAEVADVGAHPRMGEPTEPPKAAERGW